MFPPFATEAHRANPNSLQDDTNDEWQYQPQFNAFKIAKVHTMQMVQPESEDDARKLGYQKCGHMVVLVDQIYNNTGTVELRVRDETGTAMATVQDQAAEAHAGEILAGCVITLENVTAWRNTLPRPEENALFEGMNMSDPDIDYTQFYLNICNENIKSIVSPHEAVPKAFVQYIHGNRASQSSSLGSPTGQHWNSGPAVVAMAESSSSSSSSGGGGGGGGGSSGGGGGGSSGGGGGGGGGSSGSGCTKKRKALNVDAVEEAGAAPKKLAALPKEAAPAQTKAQREEAARREFQDLEPEDIDFGDSMFVGEADGAGAVSDSASGRGLGPSKSANLFPKHAEIRIGSPTSLAQQSQTGNAPLAQAGTKNSVSDPAVAALLDEEDY
jgi:hypothetical protein